MRTRTLVLDPGHGGQFPCAGSSPLGVRGPGGTREKDVTLSLARRVRARVHPSIKVVLTRDGDTNPSIAARALMAGRGRAQAFLSLHANGGAPGQRGCEAWVHPAAGRRSHAFAATMQRSLGRLGGPRTSVLSGELAVLHPSRLGDADACLLEVDYLSDAGGEARLRDERSLDDLAQALATAVESHFGVEGRARYGRGARPAVALEEPTIDVNENVTISDHALECLRSILAAAGLSRARVTSGRRTSEDQARAMYQLLESHDADYGYRLYGPAGDQVIDVYVARKAAGDGPTAIKRAMQDKIIELGPSNVSRHCSDAFDVFDVDPASIADRPAFEKALRAALDAGGITNVIFPPADPAYHVEIKLAEPAAAPDEAGQDVVALGVPEATPCAHRWELNKSELVAAAPTLQLVKQHLGKDVPGSEPALILRANEVPAEGPIDVVVYLHGYAPEHEELSLLEKEANSGLDFVDPASPENPYAGRQAATLAILPRGHQAGGRVYDWPAFNTAAGLQELIDFALSYAATQLGRAEPLARGRLILTAHSGGGLGMRTVLQHTDPDEVEMFDATYWSSDSLSKWMSRRIAADAACIRRTPEFEPSTDMPRLGSAMRVLYLTGKKTEAEAVSLHKDLVKALASVPDVAAQLCPYYRVEGWPVGLENHERMPRVFGWQLLQQAGADLDPVVTRPNPPVPCQTPTQTSTVEGQGLSRRRPAARAVVRPLDDVGAGAGIAGNEQLIASYEQELAGGFIPRLALTSLGLDQTPYDDTGRSNEFGDHFYRLVEVERRCQEWIDDRTASAIAQIRDADTRQKFLDLDWSKNGHASGSAKALFAEMAKLVPERRPNGMIAYHVVDGDVVTVPDSGGKKLYPEACDTFVAMRAAAQNDGVELAIHNSFRDQKTQDKIKASNSDPNKVAQGTSSHTYGLAIDFILSVSDLAVNEITTEPMTNVVKMYRTPGYKWLYVYAERCGWYPYSQEPWHWEYNPPGFKERFEADAKHGGLARRAPRGRYGHTGSAPASAWALDDNRYQLEQAETVRLHLADSLAFAETSNDPKYYARVWYDSNRVNFGVASWTGARIADLLDIYVTVAGELGASDRLFGYFGGEAAFDAIRDRFRDQGAAATLSAAEEAAFASMGNDEPLREAQRRLRASDVKGDLDAIGRDGTYPWIDAYMNAISEIAAHVLVHAMHQHGGVADLIRHVIDQNGAADFGKRVVEGTITEKQFLQGIGDRVVALVAEKYRAGVRARYKRLFDTYETSSLAYFFEPRAVDEPVVAEAYAYGSPVARRRPEPARAPASSGPTAPGSHESYRA